MFFQSQEGHGLIIEIIHPCPKPSSLQRFLNELPKPFEDLNDLPTSVTRNVTSPMGLASIILASLSMIGTSISTGDLSLPLIWRYYNLPTSEMWCFPNQNTSELLMHPAYSMSANASGTFEPTGCIVSDCSTSLIVQAFRPSGLRDGKSGTSRTRFVLPSPVIFPR